MDTGQLNNFAGYDIGPQYLDGDRPTDNKFTYCNTGLKAPAVHHQVRTFIYFKEQTYVRNVRHRFLLILVFIPSVNYYQVELNPKTTFNLPNYMSTPLQTRITYVITCLIMLTHFLLFVNNEAVSEKEGEECHNSTLSTCSSSTLENNGAYLDFKTHRAARVMCLLLSHSTRTVLNYTPRS